jgi:TonB family protein
MKTLLRLSALLALGVALAPQAGAAFESIQFNPDNTPPQFPLSLKMDGITQGSATIAISVSDEGRLTDWLMLGYTHELFAKASVAALKEWRFTPAMLDGTPVPAKAELTFNFTLEGAVISANIVNHFLFDNFEGRADGLHAYRLRGPSEIDRLPVPVFAVAPKYAVEAEQQGVHGRVEVRFYIDETGAVRMPAVASDTHPYLANSAVAALREWRFEPPTRHGRPVLIAASQVFAFGSN